MTMDKKLEVAAGEFKARCLALLDEVAETGREIIVTKRGKPVAKLVQAEQPASTPERVAYVLKRMKELNKGARLEGLDWKKLRDEGRR